MNILHIIGTLNIGGVQKFILHLSQSSLFNRHKHQVLCTILSTDNYRDEYVSKKISILRLPFTYSPNPSIPYKVDKLCRQLFSKLYFFRMWYYLIRSEVDIVHSHIHSHILSQISAAIFSGKRMIWSIHGEYFLLKLILLKET